MKNSLKITFPRSKKEVAMVKFKFYIDSPYGGHYNTHYARNAKRAEEMVKSWNAQFKGTHFSVHLVDIKATDMKRPPEGYTCW